jgi:hypothetical protein
MSNSDFNTGGSDVYVERSSQSWFGRIGKPSAFSSSARRSLTARMPWRDAARLRGRLEGAWGSC